MDTLAALHYSALSVLEKDWLGGEKIELPDVFPPHFLTILTIVFKDPSLFLCTTESRKRSSLWCQVPDLGNLT